VSCLFPVGVYNMHKELNLRPCGQCVSCRLKKSREWALRCTHEAKMHDENCFITLTYNNENLPSDGSLDKSHLQKFFKRLRKKVSFRYFAAGEYGEVCKSCKQSRVRCKCPSFISSIGRPHYHICMFGYKFHDLELIYSDPKRLDPTYRRGHDHTLYTSPMLEATWGKGFVTLGDLTFESAAYVARYCTKKLTGTSEKSLKMQEEKYGDKIKEFALMSRFPGIGATWFSENARDIYPKDYVTHNGTRYRPSRYYDSLYARKDAYALDTLRKKRKEQSTIEFPEDRESMSQNRFRENLTNTFKRDLK